MKRILAGTLFAILIAAPAFAVTAADVLDKMSADERQGYISGALEMAMTAASNQGNGKKAECILNWYYKGDGSAAKTLIAALDRYRDKPASAVIGALLDKQCGK